MQTLTNAVTHTEIHVIMEHVKIPMGLTSAFVHLVISSIQVGQFVWVSSIIYPTHSQLNVFIVMNFSRSQ